MADTIHEWVIVIITNPSRELFFTQQKDGLYPIPKWSNFYSFFGGAQARENLARSISKLA